MNDSVKPINIVTLKLDLYFRILCEIEKIVNIVA